MAAGARIKAVCKHLRPGGEAASSGGFAAALGAISDAVQVEPDGRTWIRVVAESGGSLTPFALVRDPKNERAEWWRVDDSGDALTSVETEDDDACAFEDVDDLEADLGEHVWADLAAYREERHWSTSAVLSALRELTVSPEDE